MTGTSPTNAAGAAECSSICGTAKYGAYSPQRSVPPRGDARKRQILGRVLLPRKIRSRDLQPGHGHSTGEQWAAGPEAAVPGGLGEASVFFGAADYFGIAGRYSLDPLRERGAEVLNCSVPGIQWIRLTQVEIFKGNVVTVRHSHHDLVSAYGDELTAVLSNRFIVKAAFAVKFVDAKPPGRFPFGNRDGPRIDGMRIACSWRRG